MFGPVAHARVRNMRAWVDRGRRVPRDGSQRTSARTRRHEFAEARCRRMQPVMRTKELGFSRRAHRRGRCSTGILLRASPKYLSQLPGGCSHTIGISRSEVVQTLLVSHVTVGVLPAWSSNANGTVFRPTRLEAATVRSACHGRKRRKDIIIKSHMGAIHRVRLAVTAIISTHSPDTCQKSLPVSRIIKIILKACAYRYGTIGPAILLVFVHLAVAG